MITSHELARKLLEGPDLPVVYIDSQFGPEVVTEIDTTLVKFNDSRTEIVSWAVKCLSDDGHEEVVRLA